MSRRSAFANMPKSKLTQTQQPPRYRREYASIAETMCKLGATPADLAKAFDVDEATINQWLVRYKAFADACRLDGEYADSRVERSLYQRAIGYEYLSAKIVRHKGKATVVENRVRVPANVHAAKFLLMNRHPDRWQLPSKIKPPAPGPAPSYESVHTAVLAELAQQLVGTSLKPKEIPPPTEQAGFGEVGEGRDDESSE